MLMGKQRAALAPVYVAKWICVTCVGMENTPCVPGQFGACVPSAGFDNNYF